MIQLWNTLFYEPLYNALFFIVGVIPGNSLFFGVIILTILVRLLIAPLSYKAIRTQLKTKLIQPELREIRKLEDKQEQAKKTLELYRENKINPFSSFLLILVQLPIILALYWVFQAGGAEFDPSLLYSFVQEPAKVVRTFFGLDLTQRSIILAFLTGFTQYIYLSISATMKQNKADSGKTDQEKMMGMVQQSMKYLMPIMITIFAYIIGGAVALYWFTSNLFMIVQELVIQRRLKKKGEIIS